MRQFEQRIQRGYLIDDARNDDSIVVLEDPYQDSPVFGATDSIRDAAMKSGLGSKDYESELRTQLKIAQNVGENKAAAKYIVQLLEEHQVPFITIAPSKRNRADRTRAGSSERVDVRFLNMPTKTNEEQFKILTGYTGRSSEHSRDAATLIHGRTLSWAVVQLQLLTTK